MTELGSGAPARATAPRPRWRLLSLLPFALLLGCCPPS